VGGAFPGAQFLRHPGILVVHDRIQVAQLFVSFRQQQADDAGVFDAPLPLPFLLLGGGIDGVPVPTQILDEAGRQFVGDEPRDERGVGIFLGAGGAGRKLQFRKIGVGGGEDAGVIMFRGGEIAVETGFVLGDGGGGAPDVAAVDPESIDEGDFTGVAAAGGLPGLGFVDFSQDGCDVVETCAGFTAAGEIAALLEAEGARLRAS
jgi:hypothetical protein